MAIKLRDSDTDEVTEIPTEASSLLACLMVVVKRAGGEIVISKEEIDLCNGTLVQNSASQFEGVQLNFVEAAAGLPEPPAIPGVPPA